MKFSFTVPDVLEYTKVAGEHYLLGSNAFSTGFSTGDYYSTDNNCMTTKINIYIFQFIIAWLPILRCLLFMSAFVLSCYKGDFLICTYAYSAIKGVFYT